MHHPRPKLFSLAISAGVLSLALLVAMPASAAESTRAAPSTPNTSKAAEPKCVHGCQRWGKQCNVDPRGVYKCRRKCEKFGEICE